MQKCSLKTAFLSMLQTARLLFLFYFQIWCTLHIRVPTILLITTCDESERWLAPRTTDTQWKYKSSKSENLGRCGRQNMFRLYLKIREWELIFSCAVKAISSPCVGSPWLAQQNLKQSQCLGTWKVSKYHPFSKSFCSHSTTSWDATTWL